MYGSMFGGNSNLPPGCRVSDIPGNRPEDGEDEESEVAFYEKRSRFTDKEWKYLASKHHTECLEEIIWKAIQYGMEIGEAKQKEYQREQAYDEEMCKEYEESKKDKE